MCRHVAILLPVCAECFCQVAVGVVWLVLSGAAGAEDGRQKSVIVGVRTGCCAVDGDIVAVPVSGIMPVDAEADVGKFAPVFVFRLPFYEFRNAGNGG